MPKACDTSMEFSPVYRCHAVQQTSHRSLWVPISLYDSSFLPPFCGPWSPDSSPLTASCCLFSFTSLCHTLWLFVKPRTLLFLLLLSSTCLLISCLRLCRITWYLSILSCCSVSESATLISHPRSHCYGVYQGVQHSSLAKLCQQTLWFSLKWKI